MRDSRQDKVHRVYLDIQRQLLEAPRTGVYREVDFFFELEDAVRKHLAASRRMMLARPTEEQATIENYSRTLLGGFQLWNEHYKNDRDKQFTMDEIDFLGNEILEFLKTGSAELPEWARNDPPDWMSDLYTLLAFCAAKDAFDREGEFRDHASWERACGRTFEAISPHVDNWDRERIFQMYLLTYPPSGTFQKKGGRFVLARKGGKYHITNISLDEHHDPKKSEDGGELVEKD